jgi:hypothetical protein
MVLENILGVSMAIWTSQTLSFRAAGSTDRISSGNLRVYDFECVDLPTHGYFLPSDGHTNNIHQDDQVRIVSSHLHICSSADVIFCFPDEKDGH